MLTIERRKIMSSVSEINKQHNNTDENVTISNTADDNNDDMSKDNDNVTIENLPTWTKVRYEENE